MNGITIEGLDDCLKLFDQAPANLMKVSKQAMRDASRATTKQVRAKTPKRWRHLVKYKVVKSWKQGNLSSLLGLFNGKQTQGHQNPTGGQIDDWFKAYWMNYGTLERRDPEHHFQTAVKHRKTAAANRRRNQLGEAPRKFFEEAINGWQTTFTDAFAASLKKQEDKLYDR